MRVKLPILVEFSWRISAPTRMFGDIAHLLYGLI
jgi:hypothetical protein